MLVDCTDKCLTVNGDKLKSNHISQLKFWGFDKSENTFQFDSDENVEETLSKLISYLSKQQIEFETTERCAQKLALIDRKRQEFNEALRIGKELKNGIFDKSKFIEFEAFLKAALPTRKLRDHQLKAAFHLYALRNAANFSVPGSGKTTVVLSVYEKLRSEGKANVLFIVGPPASFGPWKNEFIETLGRKPAFRVLAGGDKAMRKSEYFANSDNKCEMYLTTFQTLINDQGEIDSFFNQQDINCFLVIDEAHYIKQINGNWSTAVLNISKSAKFRCVLTGTPIPKGFSDLFNLFDFLWPEYDVIDSKKRIELSKLEKAKKLEEAKSLLHSTIGPLFYRVRKKDLKLKEAVFHDPILLPMNPLERKVHIAIDRHIRSYSFDDYLKNIEYVNYLKKGRIIRLRQSSSYISLLKNTIQNYSEDILDSEKDLRFVVQNYDDLELPGKLEYLSSMVTNFQKDNLKVVIWTNFVETIKKIERHFNQVIKFKTHTIFGETPIQTRNLSEELTREQIRDEFVNPDSGINILIANPAACAESISLHKTCHNAVYYDLSYNCAQYLQSLDRIHRVGGSENIEANYYFLQYENTIDQDIFKNLNAKADKMKQIIDEDYNIYSLDMTEENDDELDAYNRLFEK